MRATAMVRRSLSLAVFVVVSCVSTPRAAHPSGEVIQDNLYGVSFATPQDGWMVGAFGTVYRTGDGGKSWNAQKSGTTEHLYGVDFVDGEYGWIVGRSGKVLHTSDGGRTWVQQTSDTDKHLFSVDFVDRQFGCAVGDWGAVVVTRDGGNTWQALPLPDDIILNDVVMLDSSRGWIAGELGSILATVDGGTTWARLESGLDKTLFGVHFTDPEHGWVAGIDGVILHTTDGGKTWPLQRGSLEVRALAQVGFSQAYDNPSLYAISVVGDRGFAVGEIGAIFLSDDAGETWTRSDTPISEAIWLRDVSVVPGPSGAIVGATGLRVLIADDRLTPQGE